MDQIVERDVQEDILWKHESRNKWMKEGERNTYYIDRSIIQHKQQNLIPSLKDKCGEILENIKDIEKEIQKQHLYED